jgi:uncharacterized protein
VIVVADAGPLIYLSDAGILHLLRDLYGGVLIPREVYDEVVVRGQGEPGSSEVACSSWIRVSDRSLASPLRLSLLAELDAGEAAAITLAVENAVLVLLDERKGRTVAKRLGLQVRGTLGVLVEAKKRGQVELVGPLLQQLIVAGFRISETIKEEVLRNAGE